MLFREHLANQKNSIKAKNNYMSIIEGIKKSNFVLSDWKGYIVEDGSVIWENKHFILYTLANIENKEMEYILNEKKNGETVADGKIVFDPKNSDSALDEYLDAIESILEGKIKDIVLNYEEEEVLNESNNIKDFIHSRLQIEAKKKEDEEVPELDIDDEEEMEVPEEPSEETTEESGEESNGAISTGLMKNLIDIINEYVVSEYKLPDDAKSEIVKNMKVKVEQHDQGVVDNSPKFVAISYYTKDGDKKNVKIEVPIITEELGGR